MQFPGQSCGDVITATTATPERVLVGLRPSTASIFLLLFFEKERIVGFDGMSLIPYSLARLALKRLRESLLEIVPFSTSEIIALEKDSNLSTKKNQPMGEAQ